MLQVVEALKSVHLAWRTISLYGGLETHYGRVSE